MAKSGPIAGRRDDLAAPLTLDENSTCFKSGSKIVLKRNLCKINTNYILDA